MSTLADIRAKVIGIVRDASDKIANPEDYDRIIAAALNVFSRHRPNIAVADVTGNGTHDYSFPTGWIDEFSAIKSIEYPPGDVPATVLDDDDYEIYQSPTAKIIRLKSISPPASESFRLNFTILRTVTTVPSSDIDAFCALAASLCLTEIANAYIHNTDSTIAADSVDHRSKADQAASRAKALMQIYKEHMGIKEDDTTPAAAATADLDVNYPGGGDRLTHPRWSREKR